MLHCPDQVGNFAGRVLKNLYRIAECHNESAVRSRPYDSIQESQGNRFFRLHGAFHRVTYIQQQPHPQRQVAHLLKMFNVINRHMVVEDAQIG